MARYTRPKLRITRKLKFLTGLTSKKLNKNSKITKRPGQHGILRKRRFHRIRKLFTKVGKSQIFQRVRQLFTNFGESCVENCFILPTGKFIGKVVEITLVCILADKLVDIITLPFQKRVQLRSILRLLVKMSLRGIGSNRNSSTESLSSQLEALANACWIIVLPNFTIPCSPSQYS